ncbi:MAG: homoserine kinase [Beijerinckiaceae bacterium]|nr:homoserine kinase [Beijerinckiaceae bacterium]
MAVYTDVSDEALAAFLDLYDLGDLIAFKGIAEGVSNSNFLLETDRARYILTLYEARTEAAALPYFIALMEHLATHGITCPLPIRQRSGETLGMLAGKPAALVSYLSGVSLKRPAVAHCLEAGEAMARLHQAGATFSMQRRNDLSLAGWRPLFAEAHGRSDSVLPGLEAAILSELDYLEARWPADLPSGVIHADLFPDNVFFLRDKLSGLIDFYFACTDAFAYDLAIALNAWAFEPDFSYNVTKGRALIAGYQRVRRLEPREAEALPILVRGAALRFMLTRLVDWLNVPPGALVKPHDPLAYYKRLRFHQKLGSARDLGYESQCT